MRNDNKSWKKGVQRVGKQFGGPLARPLGGGVGARPMGGGVGGVGGVGMPARPLGFKGGTRVKKVHGGRITRPVVRPATFKGGKTAKAGGGYIYKKK